MKKKKLKKIAKYLYSEIQHTNKISEIEKEPLKVSDRKYNEYDEEVSNRMVKLVTNLLKYSDNINIEWDINHISIRVSDITSLKKIIKSNTISNEDNYLSIEVNDIGFSINYGWRKHSFYQDKDMYSRLIDNVKLSVKELNSRNFIDIWEIVSKESGILRDSNLDEILG